MYRVILMLLVILPLFALTQTDSLAPGVYAWKEPKTNSRAESAVVLFEGKTNDMAWLQMSAHTMMFSKKAKANNSTISDNEEQLIIIKSGTLDIRIKDSSYALGAGSIVLLMPGEHYAFSNTSQIACQYYELRYRSKTPADTARGKASGGSFVKDWNKAEFKPGEKGGRRNFLERSTAMCKRLEIHVTTLKEGLKSHAPHTHRSAEFTIIKEGSTEMLIGDQLHKGGEGAVYYAASNVLHALENKGSGNTTYFAIQFE